MYLYFERSNGEMQLVADGITSKNDVMPLITNDLKRRNPRFKIYYVRATRLPEGVCYDVGSHIEFYWLREEKVI